MFSHLGVSLVMHEILFVSLGTTVLDEIHIPGQKTPLLNVLGGSGIYGEMSFCP